MISALIVTLHTLVGALIIANEVLTKDRARLPLRRGVNAVYFLAFCVTPIYAQLIQFPTVLTLNGLLYLRSFDNEYYLWGALLSVLSYAVLWIGFGVGANARRQSATRASGFALANGTTLLVGVSCLLVGAVSLALFVNELGGIEMLQRTILAKRTGELAELTPLAFLISLAPLTIAAALCFFSLALSTSDLPSKALYTSLFLFAFSLSLVTKIYDAGRLDLILFLLMFPLVYALARGRSLLRLLGFGAPLALVIIVSGRDLFQYFNPNAAPSNEFLEYSIFQSLDRVFFEFAFPMASLAATIEYVPVQTDYRYFTDALLAPLYIIPTAYRPFPLPESLAVVHTDIVPGAVGSVPVDLISYGYYNGGTFALFLTVFLFGYAVSRLETALPETSRPFELVLRVGWLIALARLVAYANPVNFVREFFFLLVLTACALLFRKSRSLKREADNRSTSPASTQRT